MKAWSRYQARLCTPDSELAFGAGINRAVLKSLKLCGATEKLLFNAGLLEAKPSQAHWHLTAVR